MKKILLLIAIILFLSVASGALAAAVLEVDYPPVGPDDLSPVFGDGPAKWISYLFYFGLIITGIAAVGSLIYAGIIWMTSGVTDKIADAKSQIWAAILGIIIVASSVLILETINPDFVSFSNPTLRQDLSREFDFATGQCLDELKYFDVERNRCMPKLGDDARCSFDEQCQTDYYCHQDLFGFNECELITSKHCNSDQDCIDPLRYVCDYDGRNRCALK